MSPEQYANLISEVKYNRYMTVALLAMVLLDLIYKRYLYRVFSAERADVATLLRLNETHAKASDRRAADTVTAVQEAAATVQRAVGDSSVKLNKPPSSGVDLG